MYATNMQRFYTTSCLFFTIFCFVFCFLCVLSNCFFADIFNVFSSNRDTNKQAIKPKNKSSLAYKKKKKKHFCLSFFFFHNLYWERFCMFKSWLTSALVNMLSALRDTLNDSIYVRLLFVLFFVLFIYLFLDVTLLSQQKSPLCRVEQSTHVKRMHFSRNIIIHLCAVDSGESTAQST